jgi:hypothetical protein
MSSFTRVKVLVKLNPLSLRIIFYCLLDNIFNRLKKLKQGIFNSDGLDVDVAQSGEVFCSSPVD